MKPKILMKVLKAHNKGKEIERKAEDGIWEEFIGTDFDSTYEYRIKQTHKIRDFFDKYNINFEIVKEVFTSKRSLAIQSYIMLGTMFLIIVYQFWVESVNNVTYGG